ncbi:MAG TPA: type VI secretion system tube protein TssD [Sorangium sp.]|uniref:type VI secretion system tube protein TssD n=1 Tax=Sorangium sp. So ce1153 TaxID=3133333 RepID=UPI002CDAB556|nr:type VI secretion system tube protein TssD [Sorangium sp.]
MALHAYLRIVGTRQGEVRGSVTQKGREGTILVTGVFHSLVGPRDPVTGRPTGKRMHKPFVITKDLDRSTPLLLSILSHNENIDRWELQFYRSMATGVERPVFTVQLTNANISSIHFHMLNVRNRTHARMPEQEEVAFTYQRIIWTWNDGGVSAEDDWLTPR